jgi:hypothetical protein
MIALAFVACAHGPTPIKVHLRCEPNGNSVAAAAISDDAPVLVLFERSAGASGFDLPSLVVWQDGDVVYEAEPHNASLRLYQSRISPAEARALADEVMSRLHDAPSETSIGLAWDTPSVQIIFRGGDTWHVVDVNSLFRATREADVPVDARATVGVYHELLARRPNGHTLATSPGYRPEGWIEALPSYRGQPLIDQVVRCSLRRGPPSRAKTENR